MAAGVIMLDSREFTLREVANVGPELCTKIPGLSLVFFYSDDCKFCHTSLPAYQQLPQHVRGVHFAIANAAANNMAIVQASSRAKTPITQVPYIVAYLNGVPLLPYSGPRTLEKFIQFATEVSQKVQKGIPFAKGQQCSTASGGLGYCADGAPDDDVCLLTYEEAYGGGSGGGKRSSGTRITYGESYGAS